MCTTEERRDKRAKQTAEVGRTMYNGSWNTKYEDITVVSLNISKGRIIGATIIGKKNVMILIQLVIEPNTVIKAIREHTGPEVQWRRSPPRFTKLTGDDVDSLINRGEKRNIDEQQ